MLVNEVCKEINITKKALNYYVMKGLIKPTLLSNGYRTFDDQDLLDLKRIVLYRQLDMSITAIRELMAMDEKLALEKVYVEMSYEAYLHKKKRELVIKMMHQSVDEKAMDALNLTSKDYVIEEIRRAFPGGFGRNIAMHFQAFKYEFIDTPTKKKAFMDMIAYLDHVELEVPDVIEEIYDDMDDETLLSINMKMKSDVKKTDLDMAKYQQIYEGIQKNIENQLPELFLALKKFNEALRALFHETAYKIHVIDNMKILSEDYNAYHNQLKNL